MAKVKNLAWLYVDSSLAANANNVQLSPGRELGYVGRFSDDVKIVAYEPLTADADTSSRAMFVRTSDIEGYRVVPTTTGFTQAQLDKAVADATAKGYADAKAKATAAVSGI